MALQINFNNYREQLTENDIGQIVSIICYRCRIPTTNRIRSLLTYMKTSIPPHGIFGRIIKENDNWSYCAGQSYPDEIRLIRELLLKGK